MATRFWGLLGMALAGALFTPTGAAQASDLYQPHDRYGPSPGYYEAPVVRRPAYGEPYYAAPGWRQRVEAGAGECRVLHRRHVDAYGREIVRRLRVCDEGAADPAPRWAGRSRPDYEPQIYGVPRPPRAVRPQWDDDLD